MSLALYRKYRPGTFAEVKGQEHVTDPLRQALRTGRINHAYLFSGPRGCGKTSSARILARSLNCEKGPTPDPCGVCESCVALAPTGPGHLDVIEIDAASHGGVDDARDLRERAFFAPVSARYKIYIIDEAHMVTREGFNALLKLVEEPPPHLKFIFATTEPEKVIGTIKSRTHHYPFRLMPPATLRALLEEILLSESVPFEPNALPLVVRAGAGSARDSLSILDQLLAGADDDGITYAKAVSLLGYTDGDLLDEVVAAFAERDGARVFHTVNRVIEGGHDPRRFASDLLERFRDLVILANVPEAAVSGLLDRPADELERLVGQAASMGPAELTRAAEVFNAGLTEMRGATSPRLLLELMCARVLLPGAAQGEEALLARLERLERGGAVAAMAARASGAGPAGVPPQAPAHQPPPASAHQPPPASAHQPPPASVPQPSGARGGPQAGAPSAVNGVAGSGQGAEGTPAGRAPGDSGGQDDWPDPVRPGAAVAGGPAAHAQGGAVQAQGGPAHAQGGAAHAQGGPAAHAQDRQGYARGGAAAQAVPAPGPSASGTGTGAIQQQWPAVLAALKQRSIVVWANVSTNAQVVGVEGNLVTLGFTQVGAMKNFTGGGKDAVVATALSDVLGGTWRVEAVVGGSPVPSGGRGSQAGPPPGPARPAQQPAPSHQPVSSPPQPTGGSAPHTPAGPTGSPGSPSGESGAQEPGRPSGREAGRPTTDESWPDAPDDFAPGSPPTPDPTQTTGALGRGAVPTGSGAAAGGAAEAGATAAGVAAGAVAGAGVAAAGGVAAGATSSAVAAARSAAKAAAQAGPRAPAPRKGGSAGWPDAVPGRRRVSDADEVDPLNDADADVDELSGMALLQRELGAQVIGEIDHT
ncbi:DNA polymerase III subunit gamma and tau [Nonomuraea indica]|uniref:DNA polymerase III subunit gamma and tau n=1 Tax=Nonomuraea indica TaxID=1581193 RepID=UPI000C7B6AE1|nr:DNA polymerase III subunit gamma and tau [Nonomuraea indica]